jgi:hypothetical protein
MALTWVLVLGPKGEDEDEEVFVDSKFAESAGMTNNAFRVQAGSLRFSIKSGRKIISELDVKITKRLKANPFEVDLSDPEKTPPLD